MGNEHSIILLHRMQAKGLAEYIAATDVKRELAQKAGNSIRLPQGLPLGRTGQSTKLSPAASTQK
jgi:hypothetical protein